MFYGDFYWYHVDLMSCSLAMLVREHIPHYIPFVWGIHQWIPLWMQYHDWKCSNLTRVYPILKSYFFPYTNVVKMWCFYATSLRIDPVWWLRIKWWIFPFKAYPEVDGGCSNSLSKKEINISFTVNTTESIYTSSVQFSVGVFESQSVQVGPYFPYNQYNSEWLYFADSWSVGYILQSAQLGLLQSVSTCGSILQPISTFESILPYFHVSNNTLLLQSTLFSPFSWT